MSEQDHKSPVGRFQGVLNLSFAMKYLIPNFEENVLREVGEQFK